MLHIENVVTGQKVNIYEDEVKAALAILNPEFKKILGTNENPSLVSFVSKLKRMINK